MINTIDSLLVSPVHWTRETIIQEADGRETITIEGIGNKLR
jgi:hypothetical protein